MDIWLDVALLIFGAIIGTMVSWWFGRSASKELHAVAAELKHETTILRHLNEIVISGLANAGMIKVTRDANGVIRAVYTVSGVGQAGPATGSGGGTYVGPSRENGALVKAEASTAHKEYDVGE